MDRLEELLQYAADRDIEIDNRSVSGQTALAVKHHGDAYIAIDFNAFDSRAEQTVAVGHELGHVETDSLMGVYERFVPRGKNEFRAWKWEIKKLLPRDVLYASIARNGGRLWEVAEELDLPQHFIERAIEYYKMCA